MIRRTVRRARKVRYCSRVGCEARVIAVGDRYLELVASPDHDCLGNLGWWKLVECEGCARRFGAWPESDAA